MIPLPGSAALWRIGAAVALLAGAWVHGYTKGQAGPLREYLAAYEGSVTVKTFAEVRRQLTVDAAPILDRPAAAITRADAFALIDGMRDRPVQGMKLRRLLGAVWDRALDAGRLAPEVPNWWRMILRGGLTVGWWFANRPSKAPELRLTAGR